MGVGGVWRRRRKKVMVEIRVKQRAEFVIVDDEISSMPFTVCVCVIGDG